MDYGNIIKRAWEITWRYKILWLFGFLAGSTSSGSSSWSGGSPSSSGDYQGGEVPYEVVQAGDRALWWFQDNFALVFGIVMFFVFLGIAWWVISIAARGALIHLVNRAEEDGQVKAADGWSVGFTNWGRLFLISLFVWFPYAIVVVILLAMTVVPIVIAAVGEGDPAAIITGILGTCGVMAIAFVVLGIAGIVLGLITTFAQRHAVIGNMSSSAAIGQGWRDLRAGLGETLIMWLIVVVFGVAVGIAIGVIALIMGIGAVVAFFTTGPCGAGLVALALILFMMFPGAVLSAFVSAIWTLYWRRMTGRHVAPSQTPVQPVAQSAYVPAAPEPPATQPPPVSPVPPTPVSPPAPPTDPGVPDDV